MEEQTIVMLKDAHAGIGDPEFHCQCGPSD